MIDYPPVPPGCRYFNPRRLRRAARTNRKLQMELRARAVDAQARREARDAVRQRIVDERKQKGGFKIRVKGFVSRLFGRKTG
jgi:hypothetical protein